MVNFSDQPASVDFSGGNLDNTVACTNAVQTAGYNFDLSSGGYIAGNPVVQGGFTDPTNIDAGSGPLQIINQGGGRRKRKARRSRKLKRSNKSRLNSRSKKSRSKSVRKSKVRKSLSKRRVSLKRKSNKNRKRKSLK